jgi:hypothetical protein
MIFRSCLGKESGRFENLTKVFEFVLIAGRNWYLGIICALLQNFKNCLSEHGARLTGRAGRILMNGYSTMQRSFTAFRRTKSSVLQRSHLMQFTFVAVLTSESNKLI